MTTPLWQLNATDLATCIASGEMSAREATESVLGRIAEMTPHVKALASVTPESALRAADAASRISSLPAGRTPARPPWSFS